MPVQVSPLPIQRLHLRAPWASCWPLSRSSHSQPKMLKHEAPVIISPLPAEPGGHLLHSVPSWCLFAWLPACQHPEPSYGQASANSMANPRTTSSCSANIWKTTHICLTACSWEHVNDSGKRQAKEKVQGMLGFCNKQVIGKRRQSLALHRSRCKVTVLRHNMKLRSH